MARGKSVTKLLLDASQAALFAGIEIHNKPHIAFRYPTATILINNAWELALKAYIYKFIGKRLIYEKGGKHTIGFTKALNLVKEDINKEDGDKKILAVSKNLESLNDYRNTQAHFFDERLNPVIFMLMSKAVLNYDAFLKKYFNKDITKDDNLIILPVGMKLPFDPIDYLKQDYGVAHNEFVNQVVQNFRELDAAGVQESIVIGFDVYANRVKDAKNADIIAALERSSDAVALRKVYRETNDPKAPEVRIAPDFPPLQYSDIRAKAKERKPNIKFDQNFHDAMKKIQKNTSLCRSNYLDPYKKSGAEKKFYELAAVDVVIEEYEKLASEK